jgi:hypothetical protein
MKRIFFWFGSMISLVVVVGLVVALWSRPQTPSAVAQIDADTASPSQTWEGLPPDADILATNTAFHLWMTAEATLRTPPPTLTPSTPKVPACQFGTGIFVPAGGVLAITDEIDPTQFVFGEPQVVAQDFGAILDMTADGQLLIYETGTTFEQAVIYLLNPETGVQTPIITDTNIYRLNWDDAHNRLNYLKGVPAPNGEQNTYYAKAIGQAPIDLFPMLGDSTLANMPSVWVDEAQMVAVAKASDQQSVLAVADASAETIFIAQNPLDWKYSKSTFAFDGTPLPIQDGGYIVTSPNREFVIFEEAGFATYLYHVPSNTVCEIAIGTHPNGERENGYFFEWSPDGRFLLLLARKNKDNLHDQFPAYPVTIDLWTGVTTHYTEHSYAYSRWLQNVGHILRLEERIRNSEEIQIANKLHFINPATTKRTVWQNVNYPLIGGTALLFQNSMFFGCSLTDARGELVIRRECKMDVSGVLP